MEPKQQLLATGGGEAKEDRPQSETEIEVGKGSDNDPWRHRSKLMHCVSCMFYVEKVKAVYSRNTAPIGRCRRHAPTMNGYPVVFETDWCGDHKLNENAV